MFCHHLQEHITVNDPWSFITEDLSWTHEYMLDGVIHKRLLIHNFSIRTSGSWWLSMWIIQIRFFFGLKSRLFFNTPTHSIQFVGCKNVKLSICDSAKVNNMVASELLQMSQLRKRLEGFVSKSVCEKCWKSIPFITKLPSEHGKPVTLGAVLSVIIVFIRVDPTGDKVTQPAPVWRKEKLRQTPCKGLGVSWYNNFTLDTGIAALSIRWNQ